MFTSSLRAPWLQRSGVHCFKVSRNLKEGPVGAHLIASFKYFKLCSYNGGLTHDLGLRETQ